MIVRYKKLHEQAQAPRFAHADDACADLTSVVSYELDPGDTAVIKTGIALEIPKGWEGLVRGRSGLSSRGVLVHLGTLDSGYRGEVGVIITNLGRTSFMVMPGQRIAQLAIRPMYQSHNAFAVVNSIEFVEADLTQTERGAGGFGSTGQ